MEMEEQKRPGVFISHNHADKPFARRIADDLQRVGARVWIDEAEILLGDSLIEKIRRGIDDMDYLAVVLSPNSVKSNWVLKEVKIAYEQEIAGKKVKVLPLLYKPCTLPKFLRDKTHADFSSEENYEEALGQIIRRLGLTNKADEEEPGDIDARLEKLSRISPLLAAVLEEASAGVGPSDSTVTALAASSVPKAELEKFWLLLAEKFEGRMRLHVARMALMLLDAAGVGREAIDFCLAGERLTANEREQLGMYMQYVTSEEAVVWCHNRMVTLVRSDVYYNSFLQKHVDLILRKCYDEMSAFLLFPDRGPGSYNVDSLFFVAERTNAAEPFILRLKRWISAGLFDGKAHGEEAEGAELLYKKFNRTFEAGQNKFDTLIEDTLTRVYLLLKSSDREIISKGLYHLVAMTRAEFAGVDRTLKVIEDVYDDRFSAEQRNLYRKINRALQLLSRMKREKYERLRRGLKREFDDANQEVYLADNITGFWQPH